MTEFPIETPQRARHAHSNSSRAVMHEVAQLLLTGRTRCAFLLVAICAPLAACSRNGTYTGVTSYGGGDSYGITVYRTEYASRIETDAEANSHCEQFAKTARLINCNSGVVLSCTYTCDLPVSDAQSSTEKSCDDICNADTLCLRGCARARGEPIDEPSYFSASEPEHEYAREHTHSRESQSKNPSESITLDKSGGVYEVPVILNDVLTISFIIDSGAAEVSISPDVALTLIKTRTVKEEDFLAGAEFTFADGSKAKSQRFNLRSIKIGSRKLRNVACAVSNSVMAPMLLGQSALEKLGKYTIDYTSHSIHLYD